ncbi:MAG: cysteine--tRNA ligase [Fimbriimonadaceae bacterium]|nr:cysteine--tRNA ligase [Fimbriimonadaceae bacterium]
MPPTFKLYDTMTRTVKPLETVEPGHLRFYCCGPTVYSHAHIGNFRTFVNADLVVRVAQALGWRVTYVSNITDVGHLTQDDAADAGGEDKMARALASKDGERFNSVWELAEHYEQGFRNDWNRLNLREPEVRPRATQHMREQILAVEELISQGRAYETPTGVYFSVDSFEDYGKLSGNRSRDDLKVAVREVVQDDNKRNPADFALWKKDDKHLMQWHSPWGWGFPGWHLECSCMARAYLGDTIDLHAGGEDLVFPHHECEIAQSESLTGKSFSNHWMHVRFLQVDGEKMAKSAGNFYTLRELVDVRGFDPLAVRYALLATPYGKPLNFTLTNLEAAERHVRRARSAAQRVSEALGKPFHQVEPGPTRWDRVYDEALEALCDDLNTSVALARFLEAIKDLTKEESWTPEEAVEAARLLRRFEDLLGLIGGERTSEEAAEPTEDAAWIEQKINERAEAKKAKNFARADAIRAELDAAGIELRDSPSGTEWVRRPQA